jgi:hypothetical protein
MAQWTRQVDHPDARTWLFYGDGWGNFTFHEISKGQGIHEGKLADLNGDGRLDILGKAFRHNGPRLDIYLNLGR